jgi:hypothetical protein
MASASTKSFLLLLTKGLDVVAVTSQLPCHVVGAGTSFHHDGASLELGKELDQLLAAELLAEQCVAVAVLAMHMKAVLAKVDADE